MHVPCSKIKVITFTSFWLVDEERYNNTGKAPPNGNDEREVTHKDIKWPDLTDVWVAYPTMPGYQAYGGDDDGSIYQQAFTCCLKKKYKTHDLSAIHRMVKQIMARDAQGDNTMQPAEERNGLRFILRFGDFKGGTRSVSTCQFTKISIHRLIIGRFPKFGLAG